MTFYEEYKEAQAKADNYHFIAKDRITAFIRTGESPFGTINVGENVFPGANPAEIYRIVFSIKSTAAPEGLILVWAYPLDGVGAALQAYVSAEVINEDIA